MITAKVHKFADNINTDDIIPATYLVSTDEKELAKHCFETHSPGFNKNVEKGDVIAAGENFGCGSSREHAGRALKGLGISCVIAKSFARIFYRNAINIGLPIIECPNAANGIDEGDTVEIRFEEGMLYNKRTGDQYRFIPYPGFLREIISAGGLMKYARRKAKNV
jgi:3-isopropylmalate/(R)-2-methylmalate dehydratase small subunit